MNDKLKIAVFVDYDNIEIGVKSTLQRELDIAVVLDSLKERGDIVAKFAYADWGRQEGAKRQMAENAVQMVQRIPSPRGDKNGADINLALDALEMAFTHEHVNAFAIISGDSDFIPLVNKLKEYGKTIFVVGGRAFTSTILQKNCHEFISFESLIDEPRQQSRQHQQQAQAQQAQAQQAQAPQGGQPQEQRQQGGRRRERHRPAPLELSQAMPLVERALQVLERREVTPQLGLLKSTMLQLDATFTEKAFGAGSFTEFVEKLKEAGYAEVTGAEGRYVIQRKGEAKPEEPAHKPEEALPLLRDVLETHRIEMDAGCMAEDLEGWVRAEHADFEPRTYGFQEFSELLNFAQDKLLVRVDPEGERGLIVYLGAEFYPPAPEPQPEEPVVEEEEKQPETNQTPALMEQPKAKRPRRTTGVKRTKKTASAGTESAAARPRRTPRKKAPTPAAE
ncbi:MAG TPA: NYN domain-containing protein [Bryobacteraceae bacterium]|nr:NYN domain-containing protein [Bryobacteraceae bacterium]